jgi:hypothetical protein
MLSFLKRAVPISATLSILGLPAIKSAKHSQINSRKMVGQGYSMQNWAHIPSTLPYKCTVKLSIYSSMLGLLHQFLFLDSTSYQTSHPMELDVVLLLCFFVFAWYHSKNVLVVEMLFNELVGVMLEISFPQKWRLLWKKVFQLLEVLPSLFFPLNHACSVLGIHSW